MNPSSPAAARPAAKAANNSSVNEPVSSFENREGYWHFRKRDGEGDWSVDDDEVAQRKRSTASSCNEFWKADCMTSWVCAADSCC